MEEKGTEKKSNKFTRTLVILLIVFIAVLVLLSSRPCQRFTLTGESVILVVLLVILALSEVFDRFQLGNLLTLVWGDRIFEKCGIRRDEEGDGGKTLEIRGKRRLSARDGGANYQQS